MKIQKFTARNLQLAMLKVYEELGENALIYSTNTTPRGVEIHASAATEENEADKSALVEPAHMQPAVFEEDKHFNAPASAQLVDSLNNQISTLQDKVKKLSDYIENKLLFQFYSADSEGLVQKNMLFYHLGKLGFKGKFCQQFIADYVASHHVTDAVSEEDVEKQLLNYINIEKNEFIDQSGVLALVGPTGVGKTTTVAKLANRYAERYGADSVGIITTDYHDVFNKNQLLNFSDTFGIELEYANSNRELATALRNMEHKRIILIDTYGVNQRDAEKVKKLHDMLKRQKKGIATYITLPCNVQEDILDEISEAFSDVNLRGCILTKQDEAGTLHSALSACMKNQLKIAYICHGQDIRKDISVLTAEEVLELLKTNKLPAAILAANEKKSIFQRLVRKKAS